MTALSKSIAIKIKQIRVELDLTQQELAIILGCTFQLIQHYERGNCQMPISMLNDLAILYKVPIDWFFLDKDSLLVYVTGILIFVDDAIQFISLNIILRFQASNTS